MIILKETIKSISYTKVGFTFAVVTTVFGLLMLFGTLQLQRLPDYLGQRIAESFRLIIFLDENVSEVSKIELEEFLHQQKGIKSKQFLNKQDAKKLFLKKTGEDFSQILTENPLPESYRVELIPSLGKSDLDNLQSAVTKMRGVSDVIFEGEAFWSLQKVISKVNTYLPVISVLLLLAAFYLNYSTTRLSLEKRKPETEIMLLVGAKISTIRLPVVLYGILIAVLSILVTGAIIYTIKIGVAGYLNSTSFIDLTDSRILIIWLLSGIGIGLSSGVLCASKIRVK